MQRTQKTKLPTPQYVEEFNRVRALAVETMKLLDPRLWPPVLETQDPAKIPPYAEIETYARQLLAKFSDPKEGHDLPTSWPR